MKKKTKDFVGSCVYQFLKEKRNRKGYQQEGLILAVSEVMWEAFKKKNISQKELAKRLGKSEGQVSRLLSGDCNLRLRTIADFFTALDCSIEIKLNPKSLTKQIEEM